MTIIFRYFTKPFFPCFA